MRALGAPGGAGGPPPSSLRHCLLCFLFPFLAWRENSYGVTVVGSGFSCCPPTVLPRHLKNKPTNKTGAGSGLEEPANLFPSRYTLSRRAPGIAALLPGSLLTPLPEIVPLSPFTSPWWVKKKKKKKIFALTGPSRHPRTLPVGKPSPSLPLLPISLNF